MIFPLPKALCFQLTLFELLQGLNWRASLLVRCYWPQSSTSVHARFVSLMERFQQMYLILVCPSTFCWRNRSCCYSRIFSRYYVQAAWISFSLTLVLVQRWLTSKVFFFPFVVLVLSCDRFNDLVWVAGFCSLFCRIHYKVKTTWLFSMFLFV